VLAPKNIRKQDFPLGRRGYEPAAVRKYLEGLANAVERLEIHRVRRGTDQFDLVATEIATVLRSAHEEAARARTAADEAARKVRDEAALYAAEARREASEDRDEAKRLLLRSQERSGSLVREAEQQAVTIVRSAESLARSRANQVLTQAQRRVERLTRDERQTEQRLVAAQADLQALIERVGDRGQVIDLTANTAASDASSVRLDQTGEPDPVRAMVRAAVGRAAARAAE
jgi:cell division septum initiation protein DivIVA